MNQTAHLTITDNRSVVVFDFETTGMSPQYGDRVIEVGAVRLEDGRQVDQFQSLLNPQIALSHFITDLTGISDAMLATAPDGQRVITDFHTFVGHSPLVAHNASFDKRFLIAEFERYALPVPTQIGCSMLAARRVYPQAPNHRLGTLVSFLELPRARRFHRALDDACMTAALWTRMVQQLEADYGFDEVPFSLMQKLGRISTRRAAEFLEQVAKKQREGRGC